MDKKLIIGIICIFAIAIVGIGLTLSGGDKSSSGSENQPGSENQQTLNISNLRISSQGYGMYDIKTTLVPDKDYSYLEMVVVWYDSSGAIIEKSPLAWNMNDVTEGSTIKISGNGYIQGDEKPVKAEVYFFDNVFSGGDLSSALFNQSVEL
ncbi:hypothetical protein KQY27_00860 [Methanobrevibacter sp. TMH8]|uniref:hypothetical protein n=1 Tax=Methanobrevibacter sp. TMH8 TaxID=2848611 RepID=UPI001CD03438|nr:hypothetical protein [Methanobrevibacter sp. TMH8]MBZ9570104.1 hypothetical protein [Methanobrevibacter sp. TMH8]